MSTMVGGEVGHWKIDFGPKFEIFYENFYIFRYDFFFTYQQIECISLLYEHLSLLVGPHRKLEFFKQKFWKNGLKMPKKVPHGQFSMCL